MKITKKITGLLLVCAIALSTMAGLVSNGAAVLAVYDAEKKEECQNGNACLTVQYKEAKPTVDGVVTEGEYFEVPYSDVKGYYSYYVGQAFGADQDAEKNKLETLAKNNMHIYTCWDGQYFYFAMTAKATAADYNCPTEADSSYMYRYSCAQFGFAAADAVEKDRFEIGIGASSSNPGDSYYASSWGTRVFKSFNKGDNFCAIYDPDAKLVTYEIKVDIAEVTGQAVKDGCQMRFTYLLAKSGAQTGDGTDRLQIQCSYGIADEKRADWFLLTTFTGLDKEIEVTPQPEDSTDEEELPSFWGKTDFSTEDALSMFTLTNNATVEYLTDEDGTGFIRITATGKKPYAGGQKIPLGLNTRESPYVAIRYRTASKYGSKMGISYAADTAQIGAPLTFDRSNRVLLGTDGEWHTVVFDMSDMQNWVMNMAFWPFLNADEDVTGETFDIQWVKYYTEKPEFSDVFDPDATPVPSEKSGSSGAGLIIGISAAVVVLIVIAIVIILKKKKA